MRTGTFIAGTALILAGVSIFLVNVLGYRFFDIFARLVDFWPVLLIILGVALLWRGRMPRWVAIAMAVLLTGGLITAAVLGPWQEELNWGAHQRVKLLEAQKTDYPDVAEGIVELGFGGGELKIGQSAASNLVEGIFKGNLPLSNVASRGSLLGVDLRQPDKVWQANEKSEWTLRLSRDIIWDLSVMTGAVKGDLDLRGIPVRDLEIKVGAGDLVVYMGGSGNKTSGRIDAGASSIDLKVDRDMGVRVRMEGALTDTNLDRLGWQREGKSYISPNYFQADTRLDLEVKMGVGRFRLETAAS